jgi:predicted membrane protein
MEKNLLGGILAVITAMTLILSMEFGRSLLLVIAGFVLFIIPFTFISSFKTIVMSFLLVFFCIFLAYVIYRFNLYDMIIGIFLAFVIGSSVYYYRIKDVKTFSVSEYKKMATNNGKE